MYVILLKRWFHHLTSVKGLKAAPSKCKKCIRVPPKNNMSSAHLCVHIGSKTVLAVINWFLILILAKGRDGRKIAFEAFKKIFSGIKRTKERGRERNRKKEEP